MLAWLRKMVNVSVPVSEAAKAQITLLEQRLAQSAEDVERVRTAYDHSQLVVNQQKQMLEQATAEINRLKAREQPVKDFGLKLLEAVEKIDEAMQCLPDDLKPLSPEDRERLAEIKREDDEDGWNEEENKADIYGPAENN